MEALTEALAEALVPAYIPALHYEREEEANARNAYLASTCNGSLPSYCLWYPANIPEDTMSWSKWWEDARDEKFEKDVEKYADDVLEHSAKLALSGMKRGAADFLLRSSAEGEYEKAVHQIRIMIGLHNNYVVYADEPWAWKAFAFEWAKSIPIDGIGWEDEGESAIVTDT
jgi:hypothetical protein